MFGRKERWEPVMLNPIALQGGRELPWVPANHYLYRMAHPGDLIEWEALEGTSILRKVEEPYTLGES